MVHMAHPIGAKEGRSMDVRYEAYCFADPLFFDEQRETGDAADDFASLLPAPEVGWRTGVRGVWRLLHLLLETFPCRAGKSTFRQVWATPSGCS